MTELCQRRSAGVPIADNQNSLTAGPRRPVLIQDYQLVEKLAHENRECIPERTHAKGWGAHGTFFSTVVGVESGWRESREDR